MGGSTLNYLPIAALFWLSCIRDGLLTVATASMQSGLSAARNIFPVEGSYYGRSIAVTYC